MLKFLILKETYPNTIIMNAQSMKNNILKSLPTILNLLVFSFLWNITSISAQERKSNPNSPVYKAYHHMTAKYNGYFNAQLKLAEGIENLEKDYVDNYNQILTMFKFTGAPEVKTSASVLDEAMIKAAVDIKLHPRSVFVDDCYLLIGQSQYIKRDFENAEQTFSWMVSEFDPKNPKKQNLKELSPKARAKLQEEEKKRKEREREAAKEERTERTDYAKKMREQIREDKKAGKEVMTLEEAMAEYDERKAAEKEADANGKKDRYLLKHRPVRQDAMLWLARTQIERDKFDEAQVWLQRLEKDPKLMKAIKADLAAVNAYYYLKQKNYDAAIEPLNKAIKLEKSKKQKVRYAYILAQIYQFSNREKEAFAAYERVIRLRPNYEMEFSARLNMIKNTMDDGVALANAEAKLKKLLKDEKNEEYKDQIYFALADIAFKGKQDEKAIVYLKQSLYFNFGNKAQKSESYLKLANTYYNKENYVNAKYYYDSTLTELAKTDNRYYEAELRSNSLADIAQNIQIIEKLDSFLRIKTLVDGEKEKEYMLIAQNIKDQQEKAAAASKDKEKAPQKPMARNQLTTSMKSIEDDASGKSNAVPTFWAYDAVGMQKGRKEFQKVWGSRALSDNWRRSKRSTGDDEVATVEGEKEESFGFTKEEALALFNQIGVPQDDKGKEDAETKVIDAMSALGTLYRERLNNLPKSIEILEKLIERYPNNKYRLESLYTLYIQYNQLKNMAKANYYREIILRENKDSKFAKAIVDPNFLANEKEKENKLQDYYNDAYVKFTKGDFVAAREKLDKSESQFGKEYGMKPKFALLGAMCTGAIDGKDAYKTSLQEIVSKYPKTDEAEKAAEILAILGDGKATVDNDKPKELDENKVFVDEKTGFTVDHNSQHYIVVVYDGKKLKQTAAAATVSDYNKKYHRLKRLRTSGFMIDVDTPTILIRRFNDKPTAMEYVNETSKNLEEFLGEKDTSAKIWALNETNYKLILQEREKWALYEGFFEKYYGN
jgi:tetratricopeptide (TPR) repeat protein